jgi:cell wall-associated NlpC family hydrolase
MMEAGSLTRSARRSGWERRLVAAVEVARDQPFCWGRHDCATLAFDLRRDLTGGYDVAALWRGRYTTALGAVRVMRRLGWQSLEAAGRDLLGEPLSSVHLAQRGDLVLANTGHGFGICLGARAAGIAPEGLVVVPLSSCALAWRT